MTGGTVLEVLGIRPVHGGVKQSGEGPENQTLPFGEDSLC